MKMKMKGWERNKGKKNVDWTSGFRCKTFKMVVDGLIKFEEC
jgi:hypothetical protein